MTALAYSTLQDFPWATSIVAVKASESFEHYDDFYRHMVDTLPQNSPETRRRYAELVQRRFFPDRSLDGLLSIVWRAYHDEQILTDLMRVVALEVEPVIAQFALVHVLSQLPGHVLDPAVVRRFIQETFGEFKQNSYERLLTTCRHLGFVGRYGGDFVVERVTPSPNALLILLHDRLAPTPRIIRLSEILATQWWRFLGVREPDVVRQVLRDAEGASLLSRYMKMDELEQVTTRYSRKEYLERALRL